MANQLTLDQLSPVRRRLVGLALVALGFGLAALAVVRPELARVPLLVIWCICAALVFAGLAVAVVMVVDMLFEGRD